MEEHATAGGGHERRDVAIGPIVGAAGVLGAVIVFALVLVRMLLGGLDARPGAPAPPLAGEYARTEPPEPRLQTRPRDDLRHLRETEDRLLHGYAWVDREAGIVRIPIERAIALLAERGR